MAKFMKVGNTQFNIENIKKLSQKDFKKKYEGILKGVSLDDAYKQITGKGSKDE